MNKITLDNDESLYPSHRNNNRKAHPNKDKNEGISRMRSNFLQAKYLQERKKWTFDSSRDISIRFDRV